MKKTLIIGYGNPDRQDDGVAWHVLTGLSRRLNRTVPRSFEEGFPETDENPQLLFSLQLTPEMAETISLYERVCFIDAHTGNVPGTVHVQPITPGYQASPFTHHLTATSCLHLSQTLYQKMPEAILVSIRGYQFGFSHDLSPESAGHVEEAISQIIAWLVDEVNHTNMVL